MSNWAQSVKDQLRNDSNQPLSILEDLVEDGCNFVDDFLSRFNSHQLGPTTELVKTPSRRHNSTRRTRAAVAAAQKSAAKIKKINDVSCRFIYLYLVYSIFYRMSLMIIIILSKRMIVIVM